MGASHKSGGNVQPNASEPPAKGQDSKTTSRNQVSASPQRDAPLSVPFMGAALPETLASIGHEVRAPLAIIDGYTATLLSHGAELSPNEHEEFLQAIQQAARRLEHLTEQLLQIAHLEAGMIQLDQSVIDLSKLARAAVSQAKRLVPEGLHGRLRFVMHCRDAQGKPLKTPAFVQGDLHRLRQIVEHLVQNAVKYSPEGGRIDVIVRPAPHDGRSTGSCESSDLAFWELCVCDFGIGIPDVHLERIFDPFYRVDTRLTREQYGLGVGLAACRHLVRLHRGRIWAESCPDGGSAFHLWLPLAEALLD
jgi:signal transduction histidine kinase